MTVVSYQKGDFVYSKPGIIEEIEQRGEIGHAASYLASLYLPRSHKVHSPPSAPANPALHLHAVDAELPTTEDESPGHAVQTSLEIPCLNVPLEHGVHAPVPVFVAPALHRQALSLVLPEGEIL